MITVTFFVCFVSRARLIDNSQAVIPRKSSVFVASRSKGAIPCYDAASFSTNARNP